MMATLTNGLLLADRGATLFRQMGGGFREKQENFNPAELLVWLLILIGVFLGLNLLSRLLARRDKRRIFHSPRAMFRGLCRAHALDGSSRRLLKQLAAARGLSQPALIFLQPECFAIETLPASLKASHAQLKTLKRALFGELTSATPNAADADERALAEVVESAVEALSGSTPTTVASREGNVAAPIVAESLDEFGLPAGATLSALTPMG